MKKNIVIMKQEVNKKTVEAEVVEEVVEKQAPKKR
jgi:hypothetical protein